MSETLRQPITGPAAWRGAELAASGAWLRPLAAGEIDEIDAALRAAQARGLSWRETTRDDFPLPRFSRTLAEVADTLEHGHGFLRLRGFPVERYAEDELRIIFWGIGAHLGTAVYQNAQGEILGEVRDETRVYGAVREPASVYGDGSLPKSSRAKARSNGPLRFHTDRCDVIGLMCVRPANAGGISRVVSAPAIHNEILARRPDLHAVLCGDYWRSRQGEEANGERQAYALPVFAVRDGQFTTQYSRTYVEAAEHVPDIPPLSDVQVEALDMLHAVADELCLEAPFAPGDMQFVNNHVVYHARTAYEDDGAPGHDRLLLRLWLAMPNSRPLPEGYEILWGSTEAGTLRGGIRQPA
jgi:hypothetical protein